MQLFSHILVPTDGSPLSRAAAERAVDIAAAMIVKASHGRRGIKSLILGSETQKVLTHSKIPVIVHR